jgi:hypothetical protein
MTRKKLIKEVRCAVCSHPDRALIERAHVAGASLNAISAKYGVSRDSVHRHMKRHLSEEARASYLADIPMSELAEKAAAEGTSVLDYLKIIRSTLMQQFQIAAGVGDKHATGMLAGRLTDVLREIGKITGELGAMASSVTINNNTLIMNSPVVASLQAAILQALVPYPEARNAVVLALRQIDQGAPMKEVNALPKIIDNVSA